LPRRRGSSSITKSPHIDELEKHDWKLARELVKKAADLGLIGANIPEEYGGLGLDQTSSALVGENIGRSLLCDHAGRESGIGLLPIIYFGTEAAKQKYLPKIASGELITAYALTEAGSGSDAMAAKATARLSETARITFSTARRCSSPTAVSPTSLSCLPKLMATSSVRLSSKSRKANARR
jgi:alkylation response protein AidB-like acyl-CoA dehydrogenase